MGPKIAFTLLLVPTFTGFRTQTWTQQRQGSEQEITLTLSLRDARHLRHLRWFWWQRTSRFRWFCSSTTCKWSLSHQLFQPAAHFSLKHSVCEDCYRFAFDFGVYFLKKSTTKYRKHEWVSEWVRPWGLNESPIFTSGKLWNTRYTHLQKWQMGTSVLFKLLFLNVLYEQKCNASSYHVHNEILDDTTTGSAPRALKHSAYWNRSRENSQYSFQFVE